MEPQERGYFGAIVEGLASGQRYFFRLSRDTERPDPASQSQPEGIHGPSELVTGGFAWTEGGWKAPSLDRYAIYEVHVGTFTPEGTFDAIIPRLGELRSLGVTAIELMPVSEFPGSRNWGYDGVYPHSVHSAYGGPAALKNLVNASHREGLAVVLDVVYNHVGPEGNYLDDFGPYFTDRYRTPWGNALNFDGPDSDEVRRFFIESAVRFVDDFHVDALRLDAVHAIVDHSAHPFLQELAETISGRALLIAESDLNDPRIVKSPKEGGYGLDAQWSDDFHHSVHTLLTGEHDGYYADFGHLGHLASAFSPGYVYTGQYSPHRKRRHGAPPDGLTGEQFVVSIQNHDQVGNRATGDRLTSLVDFESQKLAAGLLLLAPFVPLLFMGQEYGEPAPFQYFVSHSDPDLVEAVCRGRRSEFSDFDWPGDVPDPQGEDTFLRSKLNWELRQTGPHATLLRLYRTLLKLRSSLPPLRKLDLTAVRAVADEANGTLTLHRSLDGCEAGALFNFATESRTISLPTETDSWKLVLNSAEALWSGSLPDPAAQPRPPTTVRQHFTVEGRAFALLTRESAS